MSYSIAEKGDTRAEAREAIEKKFNDVVLAQQAIHVHDKAAALANVDAHLALTREAREGDEVHINMHGSITQQDGEFTHASSGCSISVIRKPTA